MDECRRTMPEAAWTLTESRTSRPGSHCAGGLEFRRINRPLQQVDRDARVPAILQQESEVLRRSRELHGDVVGPPLQLSEAAY